MITVLARRPKRSWDTATFVWYEVLPKTLVVLGESVVRRGMPVTSQSKIHVKSITRGPSPLPGISALLGIAGAGMRRVDLAYFSYSPCRDLLCNKGPARSANPLFLATVSRCSLLSLLFPFLFRLLDYLLADLGRYLFVMGKLH